MSEPSYFEKQSFRQTRVRVLTAIIPVGMTLLSIWRVGLGHSFGKQPMSNASLLAWTIFLWLIYLRLMTVRLVTEVRQGELRVGLRGLWRPTRISLNAVESVRVVTVDPAKDWGGYGMRRTPRGKAFIAAGNRGVELRMPDKFIFLIGSQHAKELVTAISTHGGPNPNADAQVR